MKEAGGLEPRQDNIAVLPTQLPRLGIRATDSYQNHENTVCPPASLQFQGFQELIKTPPDDSPTGIYDFNFLLSNMSKDKHEDHTPKTVSSYSRSQFSGPSLMQDKMTCTTTNSYQMTPERGIQVGVEPATDGNVLENRIWRKNRQFGKHLKPLQIQCLREKEQLPLTLHTQFGSQELLAVST